MPPIDKTERHRDQVKIANPANFRHPKATVIGIGFLGSHTAAALARLGMQAISLIDPDTIEAHNLGSQFYFDNQVGRPKVEALANVLRSSSDTIVRTKQTPLTYDGTTDLELHDLLIVTPDNMAARKAAYAHFHQHPTTAWLIEARTNGSFLQIHAVSRNDHFVNEEYKTHHLYDDTSVPGQDLCGQKATIDYGIYAAALITRIVRQIQTGEKPPYRIDHDHKTGLHSEHHHTPTGPRTVTNAATLL